MESDKPISMGNLKFINKTSKLKIIVFTVILTVLVMISGWSIYKQFYAVPETQVHSTVVTLKDVVIAYSPEMKRIIFLNRKTGQVDFSLSDSVSVAIFALKSSEVVTDYSSSLTNQNSSNDSEKSSKKRR